MTASFAFFIRDGLQLLDPGGPMATLEAANRLMEKDHKGIALVATGGVQWTQHSDCRHDLAHR